MKRGCRNVLLLSTLLRNLFLEDNKTSGQFHSVIFFNWFFELTEEARQCQISHRLSCESVASNFSIYNAQI